MMTQDMLKQHYGSTSLPIKQNKNSHRRRVTAGAVATKHVTNMLQSAQLNGVNLKMQRISHFFDHSETGRWINGVYLVLSIIFAAIYVYNTYAPDYLLFAPLWHTELIICVIFSFDYIFGKLLLADHIGTYLLSLPSLVNLLVILPVLPLSFFLEYHTLWFGNGYWRLLLPIRFLKCYYEAINFIDRSHANFSPISQVACSSYVLILCIVLTAAGVIQIAETSDASLDDVQQAQLASEWNFFSCFFNSVLIFGTIGSPPADRPLAKVFIGTLAIVLVIIVPYQISKLFDIASSYSRYETNVYAPTSSSARRSRRHVVLTGSSGITPVRLQHFLDEMFHPDHEVADLHVILLTADAPSFKIKHLLRNPFYTKRVTLMQGSLLNPADCQRVALASAVALFILTGTAMNEDVSRDKMSDRQNLVSFLAARRLAPKVPVYAQLHQSATTPLFYESSSHTVKAGHLVVLSQHVYTMLAQNVRCPGFSTLLYNLTSSSSISASLTAAAAEDDVWEDEYAAGSAMELYTVTLPPSATQILFPTLVKTIYESCDGVIVIALLIHGTVVLNPSTSVCQAYQVAFCIARDRAQAAHVSSLRFPQSSSTLSSMNDEGILMDSPTLSPVYASPSPILSPLRATRVLNPIPLTRAMDLTLFQVMHKVVVFLSLGPHWPVDVEAFVAPLRVHASTSIVPILLGVPVAPTPQEWEKLAHFPNVFVAVGSVMDPDFLLLCGVTRAQRIVLANGQGEGGRKAANEDDPAYQDASTMVLHKTLLHLIGHDKAHVLLSQMIHKRNFDFLSQDSTGIVPFQSSRAFTSGAVISTSLCDSFLLNAFFNPMMSELTAALGLAAEAAQRSDSLNASARLRMTPLPKECWGQTFAHTFTTLLTEHGLLVVGLYRPFTEESTPSMSPRKEMLTASSSQVSHATITSPVGFVYTNPAAQELLGATDYLYVLARVSPQDTTTVEVL